ncbi:hypothetical protein [Achromobacter aegrifaciens]
MTVLPPGDAAFDIAGGPEKFDLEDVVETDPWACIFKILNGIVILELKYCQVLELS